MKFRLIMGVGFLILAGLVVVISNAGLSIGAVAFVLVLLIIGVALILSVYYQPNLADVTGRTHTKPKSSLFWQVLYIVETHSGLLTFDG